MNVDDWYTLNTKDEVITGQIVEVNDSFFRIRHGKRTRAFNIGHVVSLNPVVKHAERPLSRTEWRSEAFSA